MKKLALLILICMSAVNINANSIEDEFINMPDSIIPYFNMSIRTNLVNNYKDKTNLATKNLLDGECLINKIANDYIDMKLNKVTNLGLTQLMRNDSTKIFCLVRTYGNPAMESNVTFYTSDWKIIKDNNFGLPDFSDSKKMTDMLTWCPDTMTAEKIWNIKKAIEPVMVIAKLSDAETINICINCITLTKDEKEDLNSIKKQKSFKWNGNIFK